MRYVFCFDDELYMLGGDIVCICFYVSCFIYVYILVSQTMIHWL